MKSTTATARTVAYDVLRDVEERDAYANLLLPAKIRAAALSDRDAALAVELTAGTLRMRGRYDPIIESAARRSIDDIDPRTRNVLRLGAHQLLGMRIPAHAAVNESVELQRQVAPRAAAGFVNGVLRTIGRSTGDEWDARLAQRASTPEEALAWQLSHPVWVVDALRNALAAEGRAHELTDLLLADNAAPRVSLVVLPGFATTWDDDAATGPSPYGIELSGGDPALAAAALGAEPGTVRVQDQGSQLAALALVRAMPVTRGETWLDLCAGPGGKTALLAALARQHGVRVRAGEASPHRAELVRAAVRPMRDVVDVVVADGRSDEAYGGAGERFSRILVDAPCTGLGALRRRPEARWRKAPSDVAELAALQRELLAAAVHHLAPGGVLAYVTCSPHLAETREAVDALLAEHPELRELDAKAIVSQTARVPLDLAGSTLSAQLWPHRHHTDAMFIALIGRVD